MSKDEILNISKIFVKQFNMIRVRYNIEPYGYWDKIGFPSSGGNLKKDAILSTL